MSELQPLQAKLDALIAQLSRSQGGRLSRKIAKQLATSQRQRIARQQNPDGSAFAPRKPQKSRKGSIKQRAMFRKLRTARLMRSKATADGVELGYTGTNAHIARVHQFGLRSKVNRRFDWKVQYAQRELLGFSEQDLAMVEDEILAFLAAQ